MPTRGLTGLQRFLIGGVGGLAPVLLFVVQGDFDGFATNYIWLKQLTRIVIFFLMGGFVAWLHSKENVQTAVFLLGLGAPTMIAGFQNSLAKAQEKAQAPATESALGGLILLPVVHAQSAAAPASLKHFTLPEPSAGEQIYAGLTGARPANVWFVIAGSYLTLDSARVFVQQINTTHPEFAPDVYAPYRDNPYYSVVIGAQMTQQDAASLRDKAQAAGLKKTYYKTFPNLPYP